MLLYVPSYTEPNVVKLCCSTGPIPAELGQLVNLTHLYLLQNQLTGALWYVPSYHTTDWLLIWLLLRVMLTLQVPDYTPTDEDGDMYYSNREEVAAFQACLK